MDHHHVMDGNANYREYMDKLHQCTNVSKYMDLPMIAVMGDTSSGKSSLLSSISMVELPSSHELTTRCPVLIKMSKSDTKSATVSITWREGVNENNDFTPRTLNEFDMDALPESIAEAQQHILQQTQKEVARDVINVTIQGPDCHDLTLLDLPGMVRTHAMDESQVIVEEVAELIQEFLVNPRCVILAVVPANLDFHNSQIMADAQRVDPDTTRTIPVITKPDLIDKGAEDQVLDLLLGRKMEFSLGFSMIKGRSQAALDRKDSIEACLYAEQEYFDSVEPWCFVEDRTLFGTLHLRRKLGDLQMTLIQNSLPGILQEMNEKRRNASTRLEKMGSPHLTTADKRRYYHDACAVFMSNLKSSLSGKNRSGKRGEASAAAKLHEACATFMSSIRQGSLGSIKNIIEGAQVLVTSSQGDVVGDVVHVGDGYACVDCIKQADHSVEVLFDYVGYHSDEPLEEDDVWSDGSKVYIARANNRFDMLKQIPLDKIRTDPSWLKDKIADNRTDDLACFLNVDIFKNIVAEFIEEDWKPHCNELVEQTSAILQSAVAESLAQTFDSSIRYPKVRAMMKRSSQEAARALVQEARKQVQSHLEIEKHPYTQDHVLFEHIASARHRGIKRELEVALRLDQSGAFDTAAIKTIMDGVFERNRRKTVEEHMAEDMEIVLESYGKVATKRVIDRTPMICWEVFRSLATSVQESLWSATDETLEEAMQDAPDFVQKHKELSDELEEMTNALNIFQSLA